MKNLLIFASEMTVYASFLRAERCAADPSGASKHKKGGTATKAIHGKVTKNV